ncbi:MAG: T9SS type A sorting domain-containing protein [Bacteroidetes bacterium]|nr:T9SS type A sorting domain-containing protein [Bacteroidota bacterium]
MAYTIPRLGKAMNAVGYSVGAEELPEFNILISPNPSSYSSIISSQGTTIRSVSICDVLGRPIYVLKNIQSSQVEIPTKSWARGTYIVRIETDKGVKTAKLVRN